MILAKGTLQDAYQKSEVKTTHQGRFNSAIKITKHAQSCCTQDIIIRLSDKDSVSPRNCCVRLSCTSTQTSMVQ